MFTYRSGERSGHLLTHGLGHALTQALLAALAAHLLLAMAPTAARAQQAEQPQQEACGFSDGFAVLRRQLGAAVVGECLEAPRAVEGGDVHQRTTKGLLVWSAVTNLVAFTDGARTWVSGPEGLQVRPNDGLFEWEEAALRAAEADAAEITPRELALTYVETVRGNVDNKLEHIYAAAYKMASERFSAWMEEQRVAAAGALAATWSRFTLWTHGQLQHLVR